MDKGLSPGVYAWDELSNKFKEAAIVTYHREMCRAGFTFTVEEVRGVFVNAKPVIDVEKGNVLGINETSRPLMEYFISKQFHKNENRRNGTTFR